MSAVSGYKLPMSWRHGAPMIPVRYHEEKFSDSTYITFIWSGGGWSHDRGFIHVHCRKLGWRCWFYARFLWSNNFYVSCFPVPNIVIKTVSVLCYKPFRPRVFVMNSALCQVLSVINPLPARLDNYLVSGNWKCRPEFSSLFGSLIIPRLGRPSHVLGMWLETFKRDTRSPSNLWKINTNIRKMSS